MPSVTFFSVLELSEKNRKGGCNNPPLVRRGLKDSFRCQYAKMFRNCGIAFSQAVILIAVREVVDSRT